MMVSFIIIYFFDMLMDFTISIDMPVVFMLNMVDDGDGDDENERQTGQIIRSEYRWSYSTLTF